MSIEEPPPKDLTRLKIDSDQRRFSPRAGKSRRPMWWIAAALLLVVVLAVLIQSGALSRAQEVQTVKVAPTFPSRALSILNASGYVVAQRKAAVASKATGRLERLYVEEGKTVKEGDILAQLDNEDLKATLEEAQAGLRVAKATLANAEAELEDATIQYNRHKGLRESGSVSEQAFDIVHFRYKKAIAAHRSALHAVDRSEATVRVAEVNYEYSLIRAPFDGVILTKNADKGEVVAPFGSATNAKAAVVTMADLSSLMVEVDVSESSIEKVKIEAAAEIRLDAYPEERFAGTVHMIVPTADRSKATVTTKVKFDKLDGRVLPEMSAKVAFLSRPLMEDEHRPVLAVPRSAVRTQNDRPVVFRVNDHRAHQVSVKTGRQWREIVEILSGLKEHDLVILRPDRSIRDGVKVKVVE